MNDKSERVVYRTRGGLLSLAELRLLAEAATAQGTCRLYTTGRQEIVLSGIGFGHAKRLLGQPPDPVLQPWSAGRRANIMTTAPVAGLDDTRRWLSEGAFRDVLDRFAYVPGRPVALTDPSQAYLPAFLGEITFLAMEERDHWRIRVALGEAGEEWMFPGAIRTKDIPDTAQIIEQHLGSNNTSDVSGIAQTLVDVLEPIRLVVPITPLHGPLRYESPRNTLTIPIPDEGIRSDFCLDLCLWAARRTGITVGLTPWSTFLIRGVSESNLRELRTLMIRHGIAEACGRWRPYCFDAIGNGIAARLCRVLNERFPVDAGISLGVISATATAPDVHLLVREKAPASWRDRFRTPRYRLERRESEDVRTGRWHCIAENIRKRDLSSAVVRAIETVAGPSVESASGNIALAEMLAPAVEPVHRCRSCLNEYAANLGDPVATVPPGTEFHALADTWLCPVCGGPKSDYQIAAA